MIRGKVMIPALLPLLLLMLVGCGDVNSKALETEKQYGENTRINMELCRNQ